jgi:hypothetical protein
LGRKRGVPRYRPGLGGLLGPFVAGKLLGPLKAQSMWLVAYLLEPRLADTQTAFRIG